jgi:hypothetical protein
MLNYLREKLYAKYRLARQSWHTKNSNFKKYKFRLRESYRSSNYSTDFDTKSGVWTSIEILVSDLNPMFMGYYSRNTKKLEIENISSLGFQISDKQEGEFKLEIMHVKALY